MEEDQDQKSCLDDDDLNSESPHKRLCIRQQTTSSISCSSVSPNLSEVMEAAKAYAATLQAFMQRNNVSSLPPEFQNINVLLSAAATQNTAQNIIPASTIATNEGERSATTTPARIIAIIFSDLIHPVLLKCLKEHQLDAINYLSDRIIGKNCNVTIKRSGG
uniref:Uncharacterized protein n=1 Tax=Panagrolaimus sp. ES5 TaxID=591445 RepID=A0AC34FEJ2_9BILA